MNDLFSLFEATKVANHNADFKIKGLAYLPNFVSEAEHDFLLDLIDKETWINDLKRRVQHYGYKYDYRFHKIDHNMKIAELPTGLMKFAIRLKEQGIFTEIPDQVIVNEYMPGQGITNHIDCLPCFSDTIASLSLGSQCVMNFTKKDDKNNAIPYLLEKASMIILKEDARYCWMHGIKMAKTDNYFGTKIIRKRRVSLTFRKVNLEKYE